MICVSFFFLYCNIYDHVGHALNECTEYFLEVDAGQIFSYKTFISDQHLGTSIGRERILTVPKFRQLLYKQWLLYCFPTSTWNDLLLQSLASRSDALLRRNCLDGVQQDMTSGFCSHWFITATVLLFCGGPGMPWFLFLWDSVLSDASGISVDRQDKSIATMSLHSYQNALLVLTDWNNPSVVKADSLRDGIMLQSSDRSPLLVGWALCSGRS